MNDRIFLFQSFERGVFETKDYSAGRLGSFADCSLKLARTIADLDGSDEVQSVHPAEALQYRPKLMMGS